MFSRIFIERPRLAFVISIVMVLAGILAVRKLPVAEYPEVTPPTIMIYTFYYGASATEIQDTLAMPLEKELNGLEDMIYFASQCNNSGLYECTITFKTGVNDDIAMVNVQNAIKRAESRLPSDVRNYGVNVRKRNSDILSMFVFMTDGTKMSVPALNNYCSTTIVDNLARIDGVSATEVWGAQNYSMRIWLDPLRMAGLGISVSDVSAAVQQQNLQAAAGNIGSEGASQFLEYKLNVRGRLKTPEEFEQIILRRDASGNLLRLKDVARVEIGAETYNSTAKFNGRQSVAVAVYRNSDANALATVNRVKAKIEEISHRFPEGVTYQLGYDPTRFITISMREIVETLVIALVMVVLITYLFLQDWRATLVPAVAIPVALMATFPFMYLLGISINVLSMFGLVLVIGSLVDDAIVVVENTQSLMAREKLGAKAAAQKSMEQITGAIIATTLVTIACYMPLAFYGGMVGRIYVQFAVTMCISLCISTFVAMTLSPALCSLIMRPPREKPLKVFAPFNLLVNGSRRIYLFCVRKLVRQGLITLALLAAVVYGIWWFSERTPSSFLPTEDKGAIMCSLELASGATLNRTNAAIDDFYNRIKDLPGVHSAVEIAGFSFVAGQGENCGMVIVDLEHWDKRKAPELQLEPMRRKIEEIANQIPEAKMMVFTPPAIMGLGISGAVSFEICSDDGAEPAELAQVAQDFAFALMRDQRTQYAMNTFSADTTQLFVDIDREKAESLGVTAGTIFFALQSQLAAYYINDFNYVGNVFQVKMQSESANRVSIDDVRDIQIRNALGEMVPLSSIATLRFDVGPRRIQRFNKMIAAEIQAQAKTGISSGEMMRLIEATPLPPGYHIEWTGLAYQERENQGQIVSLMALAMLFAYLFLVGQYESWTIPIPVMLTVFTALLGAFIGLHYLGYAILRPDLAHTSLSIYAQLGLVMLIGLTAKNAILMVEFSKQERERGVDVYNAAINGANLRYRAVLMTAWSFVFGVWPLVIATGAGASSRNHIGISSFSGMLLATLFGIILTPALYAVFQRIREFVKHLLGWDKGK